MAKYPIPIRILIPFQRINDDGTVGFLKIDHHVESVHEDIFFQDREDLIGRDFDLGYVALLEGYRQSNRVLQKCLGCTSLYAFVRSRMVCPLRKSQ